MTSVENTAADCAETQRLCAAARELAARELAARGAELRILLARSAEHLRGIGTALKQRMERSAAARSSQALGPAAAADLADDINRVNEQALTLSALADYLSESGPWLVRLRDAVAEERRLFAQHFPQLDDTEARIAVDGRYERYLAG